MTGTNGTPAAAIVARLGAEYQALHYSAEPLAATADGVPGHDAEMPDPSRAAGEQLARDLAVIGDDLSTVDESGLEGEDWLSRQTLAKLVRYEQEARRHGLRDVT